jgi:hypothetical protein
MQQRALVLKEAGAGVKMLPNFFAAKKVITETFTTFVRHETEVNVHSVGPVMEDVIKTK